MENICDAKRLYTNKILYLDIKVGNKRQQNTAAVLVTSYIGTIWFNRFGDTAVDPYKYKIKILNQYQMLSKILEDEYTQVFTVKYGNSIFMG